MHSIVEMVLTGSHYKNLHPNKPSYTLNSNLRTAPSCKVKSAADFEGLALHADVIVLFANFWKACRCAISAVLLKLPSQIDPMVCDHRYCKAQQR